VEAEKVGVAEVGSYFGGDVGCEDGIEEEIEVCVDDLVVETGKAMEGINGVGDDAICLSSGERFDCSADVAGKGVVRRLGWRRWRVDRWERLRVEAFYYVLVGRGDGCFRLGAGGAFVGGAPVIVVGCMLDGAIVGGGSGWGSGCGTADDGLRRIP